MFALLVMWQGLTHLLRELGDGAQHRHHVHDLERPLLGLQDGLLTRDEKRRERRCMCADMALRNARSSGRH